MSAKISSKMQASSNKNINNDADDDIYDINKPHLSDINDSNNLNQGVDQSDRLDNRSRSKTPDSTSSQDDRQSSRTKRSSEDSSSGSSQAAQTEPPRDSFIPLWDSESRFGRPEPISRGIQQSAVNLSSGNPQPDDTTPLHSDSAVKPREINVQIKGTAIEQGASYVVLNKDGQEIAEGVDGEDGGVADGVIKFSTDESQIEGLRVSIDNSRSHDFFLSVSPSTSSVSSVGDDSRDGSENTKGPAATIDFKNENGTLGINANMSQEQVDYFKKIVNGNLIGNYASNPTDPQNKVLERKLLNGSASQAEISNLLENVNDVRQHKISSAKEALTRTLLNLDMVNSMGFEYPQSGDDPTKMAATVRSNVTKIIDRIGTLASNVYSFDTAVAEALEYGVDPETLSNELSKNLELPINSNNPTEKVSFDSLDDVRAHVLDKVGDNLSTFKKQLDIVQSNESKTLSAKEAKDQQETIDLAINAVAGVLSIGEIVGNSVLSVAKLSTARSKDNMTNQLRRLAYNEGKATNMPAAVKKLDDKVESLRQEYRNLDDKLRDATKRIDSREERVSLLKKKVQLSRDIDDMVKRNAEVKDLIGQLQRVDGPNKGQIQEMINAIDGGSLEITPFWKMMTTGPGKVFDGKNLDLARLDAVLANFKNMRPATTSGASIDKSAKASEKSNAPSVPQDELDFSALNENGVRSAIENLPEYRELINTLKPMVLRGYAEKNYTPLAGSDYAETHRPYLGYDSDGSSANLQVSLPPSARFVEKVNQNMKRAAELNAELKRQGNESSRYLVVDERFLRTTFNALSGARPTFETRIIRVDNWQFGLGDPTIRIGNNPEVFDKYRGVNTRNVEWTPELSRQYYRYPSSQKVESEFPGDEFPANQPYPWSI